jgi:hypothetical protein
MMDMQVKGDSHGNKEESQMHVIKLIRHQNLIDSGEVGQRGEEELCSFVK